MNVLVLDDEIEIADLLELILKNEGFNVKKCYNSKDAIHIIETVELDLAILDVMVDGLDGFDLVKLIRGKNLKFPVIFLTAKIADEDKVRGLMLGADDYITKPFNHLEFIARVKAAIRRSKDYNEESNSIYASGLSISLYSHKCTVYDKEIFLTPLEFDILYYLMSHKGKVVSSEELFEKVWKEKYFDSNNTIMVHIRRIREKLGDSPKNPKFIKTVWGVGYKIEDE